MEKYDIAYIPKDWFGYTKHIHKSDKISLNVMKQMK